MLSGKYAETDAPGAGMNRTEGVARNRFSPPTENPAWPALFASGLEGRRD